MLNCLSLASRRLQSKTILTVSKHFQIAQYATSKVMKTIKVDIVSDTICPWCYVGRNKLEKGVEMWNEENPEDKVQLEVHWHPFELDPTLSEVGENKMARYLKKFGPQFKMMEGRLHAIGKDVGINFTTDPEAMVGKTIDTHRLVEYTEEELGWEKAHELVKVMFNGYFEQAKNPTDKEWMVDCYMKVNPEGDRAKVTAFINSDEKRKEVQAEAKSWAMKGIGGVPYFIFNGKYGVSGAQDSELFKELIGDLVDKV